MDKINKMLLEALKASLCRQKVNWNFRIQPEEWRRLFWRADTHHILPMIYDAVYNCPAAGETNAAFFAQFKRKTIQQVMIQTMKTAEFLQLYQYLKEAGLEPVLVKGIICRELYPEPDYRSSGDEDMLIRAEDFALCHKKLQEYGMVVADPDRDIQEVYEVPYGKPGSSVYIELHKSLFPPDSEAYGDFNRFFEHVWDRRMEFSVQGIQISAMSHTEHLFYLICHAFKHFLHSGFGIRQVCDITLYANAYGKYINWYQILEQCREINAELFAAALFRIGRRYLTFEPGLAGYPDEWERIEVDEADLLEDLLNSGIYGDADMSRKHSSNITLNAVSAQKKGKWNGTSLLKTVFPPAKNLEGRYPCLKEQPYLLPVAWASRILKYKKEISQAAGNDAASSIHIGNQRIELMKKYGIIRN